MTVRSVAAAFVVLALAAVSRGQDAPAVPPAPAAEGAKPADLIPWIRDYAAAKERAAKEKKGLLVYLTPAWFT